MIKITETGARIMTQALCRSFVDQTPATESPQDWVIRARQLQASIGTITLTAPTADDIQELVTSYEELQSVECGTHPDLQRNHTYTVDNSLDLTEAILTRINDETTELLNNARAGKQAAV